MSGQFVFLAIVMLSHLLISPYTKVEESFNMQAIHDILYYLHNISAYDHLEFPGVVPRSFIGPLVVSAVTFPIRLAALEMGADKFILQLMARAVLGLLTLLAMNKFIHSIHKKFGKGTTWWFVLLTGTQFHLMFYMSRTLPNVFALIVTLMAMHYWLEKKHGSFIWASGLAIIVFRSELCLFLGIILLMELGTKRLSILIFLKHTIFAGPVWLGLTIVIDSYFWQRPLWPEGEVLWYNTFLNKSSNWGTSPFLWYFYSAIPRALSATLLLVPVGLCLDRRTVELAFPAVSFVFLYSFLPHKELRFIIYAIPVLTAVAAVGADRLWKNKSKNLFRGLLAVGAISVLVANAVSTAGFTYVAHMNYPGGVAMAQLHKLIPPSTDVHVHIDVGAAQTGVTRFTQLHDHWIYNKTEDLSPGGREMMAYTHLLVEVSSQDMKEIQVYSKSHSILTVLHGFDGVGYSKGKLPPFFIKTKPKIALLQKI